MGVLVCVLQALLVHVLVLVGHPVVGVLVVVLDVLVVVLDVRVHVAGVAVACSCACGVSDILPPAAVCVRLGPADVTPENNEFNRSEKNANNWQHKERGSYG